MSPPALEMHDVVKHFGGVRAVDGVSLTIERGKVLALVGESGSGKSTVGRLVVRLLQPSTGQIRLAGTDVSSLGGRALRPHRRKVSIVFQDPASSIDPRLSVGQVVGEPLALSGTDRRERTSMVSSMLDRVGLGGSVQQRYPHELSGGQRQRVAIARALVSSPDLLVADEPTSALDVSVQASVLNLITDLQDDLGFACLFITHDLTAVEYLADDVAVMYLGVIVEQGTRDQIFDSPTHPYTQSLLSAAPVPDPVAQRSRRRVLLSGDLPSASNPPSGCRFHTRCPVAESRCRTQVPDLIERGDHPAACHLVDAEGAGPDVRESSGRPDVGSRAGDRPQEAATP